ncbi:MAG: ABC transporter ATP-binding protein [Rhodobiaceae bacterium]|nr:ABC transporter ATP-binding protein [Rhodobiaceae bacterium]
MSEGPLIEAQGLFGGYGGADILCGANVAVRRDQIGVIVGPNGAGKSTLLKALFGLITVREGTITLGGADITNAPPEKLVPMGMAYVPQEQNVFPTLSVRENLEMGAFIRRDDISGSIAHIMSIFPPLADKMEQPAGELSGGQRQMVAMGRALMSEPSLILLDEPTAGLSPLYMDQIFERVVAIRESGVGVLMVEQNAKQALGFADIGFVLAQGQNRFTDSGKALLADPEVARSFLGG